MPVAVSLCQFVLAAVFAAAGAAKLLDRAETRRAVAGFGAPARLQAPLAIALPVTELAIAGALFVPAIAGWAALAALAVLVVFSAAIVRALARGSAPDCGCFGGLTQTRVGRGTLMRNLLIGGLAAFAASGAGEPAGAAAWIADAADDATIAAVVIAALVAALAALGWFCWALLRQNGRLLLHIEAQASELGSGPADPDLPALAVGDEVPELAAVTLDGHLVSGASLLAPGLPVAIVFADTHCGACADALAEAAQTDPERVTVAVVMRGDEALAREHASAFGLPLVVHNEGDALFQAFRVRGAPGTLLLDSDGRLATPVRMGSDAARDALRAAAQDAAPILAVSVAGA